jgi:hypothetical protein
VAWQGGGDIDSVAISPTGITVAIETKTKTYERRHLARLRERVTRTATGACAAMPTSGRRRDGDRG